MGLAKRESMPKSRLFRTPLAQTEIGAAHPSSTPRSDPRYPCQRCHRRPTDYIVAGGLWMCHRCWSRGKDAGPITGTVGVAAGRDGRLDLADTPRGSGPSSPPYE